MAQATQQFHLADRRTPTLIALALVCFSLTIYGTTAGAQQASRMPRVRSDVPLLSAAIAQGVERSTTFRRLIEALDMTDRSRVRDGRRMRAGRAGLSAYVRRAVRSKLASARTREPTSSAWL